MYQPNEKESKYIKVIMSMCIDTLVGKGVTNVETFISNCKFYLDGLKKENEKRMD